MTVTTVLYVAAAIGALGIALLGLFLLIGLGFFIIIKRLIKLSSEAD